MTRGLRNRLSAGVITIAALACAGGCSSAYYIHQIETTKSSCDLFNAIDALGDFETDVAARKKLVALLDEQDYGVRRRAARSLGKLSIPDIEERKAVCRALILRLNDCETGRVCREVPFLFFKLGPVCGSEPPTRFEAVQALWWLTRKDLGFDQQAWLDWVNHDMDREADWPSTRPAIPQSQPAGAISQVRH